MLFKRNEYKIGALQIQEVALVLTFVATRIDASLLQGLCVKRKDIIL